MTNQILRQATFDERLKTYELLTVAFVIFVTLLGIPLLLLWFFGFGQFVTRKRFESMECTLRERSLNFSKGVVVRVQKNVPLDKITDLAVIEGPLLRKLGLVRLKVETAGQSAGPGGALLSLIGIEDALAFRDAVLEQRDRVTAHTTGPSATANEDHTVLAEIRDALLRIEAKLSGD